MGYYCTVPQCTSLAGKTKNVKFHRFPRDETLAHRWNEILHRNKPFTKYSKVCSLHFTQGDYNITTMGKKTGQWKTLSKDAIPTQNLPKLNADGTVMVIRKSRTLKYKPEAGAAVKKEGHDDSEKRGEWNTSASSFASSPGGSSGNTTLNSTLNSTLNTSDAVQNRLSALNAIASCVSPQLRSVLQQAPKPMKHDAIMQTDPLDISNVQQTDPLDISRNSDDAPDTKENGLKEQQDDRFPYPEVYLQHKPSGNPKNYSKDTTDYGKEYVKDDYKSAESYGLERNGKRSDEKYSKSQQCYTPEPVESYKQESYKAQEGYDKIPETYKHEPYKTQESYAKVHESYDKAQETFDKLPEAYKQQDTFDKQPEYKNGEYKTDSFDKSSNESYESRESYAETYTTSNFPTNSVDILRNQQHNLHMLQQQPDNKMSDDARFYGGPIKEEMDLNNEEEKFLTYDSSNTQKEDGYASQHLLQQQQRMMDLYERRAAIKSEPELSRGCETTMQPQQSPLPNYYRSEQHSDTVSTAVSAAYYSQQREEILAQQQALAQQQQQQQQQQQLFSQQPGAELLIAKQNALAATLWQNSMKTPFYYRETPHGQFNSHSRYEDITRLLNQ